MAKIIGDKFLEKRTLGEGATGRVIEAAVIKDCAYASVGESVAIKTYKPWVLDKENQQYRLLRELEAGISLDSPNIVKTFELGKEKDDIFLVMEFLEGETLTKWLQDKVLPTTDILSIAKQIAHGIKTIHESGLIHRDIKPDNIMMVNNCPIILDLGVLKDLGNTKTVTEGDFLGTIMYAAPEYLFGEEYNNKIDVYSFGSVLHEIITGEPLIRADLYWSKQILEKPHKSFYSFLNPKKYYDRFGFSVASFLSVLLQITATTNAEQRCDIAQVCRALETEVWKHQYLAVLYRKNVVEDWPNIPQDLQEKIDQFKSKYHLLDNDVKKRFRYDIETGLPRVWCYQDDKEEEAELEKLYQMGLITSPGTTDYMEVHAELTPLAWQLLIEIDIMELANKANSSDAKSRAAD